MKKVYILSAMIFPVIMGMVACKPSVKVDKPVSAGNAVFTNYLAIGAGYTAGAADSSIYVSSQVNSFPQRLFEQFGTVAGNSAAKGPFIQPLLVSDAGYPGLKLVLGTVMDTCQGTSSLMPVTFPGSLVAADGNPYVSPANHGQINNIGVPYLRVADFDVAGYSFLNPFAKRFYQNINGTPEDELAYMVRNLYPTFFTFWLGQEDILGYALAGGQGIGNIDTGHANPLGGGLYNPSDITPRTVFESLYDTALNMAMSNGASGALINIPDITAMPFFTAIPINGLYLTTDSAVNHLDSIWRGKLPQDPVFHLGYNNFIVQANDGLVRQAVPGELVLLTTPIANITCYGWGSTTAIPSKYVLTTDELQFIRTAITQFNGFILQESQKYHLAYVDMNTYLGTLTPGMPYNGINYTAAFVSGGTYSLDGLNFTQRGYALVANEILSTINAYYHSTLPLTNANAYLGIQFP